MKTQTENRGGRREGAGRKAVPSIVRKYRVPLAYKKEASAEIKAILKKYRIKYLSEK